MPMPGSPNAPHSKGERVSDFLHSVEAHAAAANVGLNDLAGYALHYRHRRVQRLVLEDSYFKSRHMHVGMTFRHPTGFLGQISAYL